MSGSSDVGASVEPVVDEIGSQAAVSDEPTRADRLRRILFWTIGIGVVVAILGTVKWWGDQQQRAALRGRSWPPEPVKVFFGR
jgi:hypothetical protein